MTIKSTHNIEKSLYSQFFVSTNFFFFFNDFFFIFDKNLFSSFWNFDFKDLWKLVSLLFWNIFHQLTQPFILYNFWYLRTNSLFGISGRIESISKHIFICCFIITAWILRKKQFRVTAKTKMAENLISFFQIQ